MVFYVGGYTRNLQSQTLEKFLEKEVLRSKLYMKSVMGGMHAGRALFSPRPLLTEK